MNFSDFYLKDLKFYMVQTDADSQKILDSKTHSSDRLNIHAGKMAPRGTYNDFGIEGKRKATQSGFHLHGIHN